MSKAVVLPVKDLRPLPKVMWGTICSKCNRAQSKWEANKPAKHLTCSICYLYQSKWGEDNRQDIDGFIAKVEVGVGHMFNRDMLGRLSEVIEADRILGAIAMSSRLFKVQDKVAVAKS